MSFPFFYLLQHWKTFERDKSLPPIMFASVCNCWFLIEAASGKHITQTTFTRIPILPLAPKIKAHQCPFLVISNTVIFCFFLFLTVWSFTNVVLATWSWKGWEDALQVHGATSSFTDNQQNTVIWCACLPPLPPLQWLPLTMCMAHWGSCMPRLHSGMLSW